MLGLEGLAVARVDLTGQPCGKPSSTPAEGSPAPHSGTPEPTAAPTPAKPAAAPSRDPLQHFANSQREVPGTKSASEYTSPSGRKYYSTNRHGMAGELENMPELRNAVEAAGHHGGCAEVGCLIQAYRAEGPSAITGGIMRTVNVRNPMSSRAGEHGTPAFPCGRCQRLLGLLGISWS